MRARIGVSMMDGQGKECISFFAYSIDISLLSSSLKIRFSKGSTGKAQDFLGGGLEPEIRSSGWRKAFFSLHVLHQGHHMPCGQC